MSYPDDHRGHEAYCETRCAWTARSATPEGALVLAEHHTRQTRTEQLAAGGPTSGIGHRAATREVSR